MINISELNIIELFTKLKTIAEENYTFLQKIEKHQKATIKTAQNLEKEISTKNILRYCYHLLEYKRLMSLLSKPLNEIQKIRQQITSQLSISWIGTFINIFRNIQQTAAEIASTIDTLCSEHSIKMSFENLTSDKNLELSNKFKLACEKILVAKENGNLNLIKNDLDHIEREALSLISFINSHVAQEELRTVLLELLKESWIGKQGQNMKLIFRKLQSGNQEEIATATSSLIIKLCNDYQTKLEEVNNNLNLWQPSFHQKSNSQSSTIKKDNIVTQWVKYLSLPSSLRLLLETIDNLQKDREYFIDSFKQLKKDIKKFFKEKDYHKFITTQFEPELANHPDIKDFLDKILERNQSKNESLKPSP